MIAVPPVVGKQGDTRVRRYKMEIETNPSEAEIARGKRIYSISEAETTIAAHGRYESEYSLVKVSDRHFIVRFTNSRGSGVWGGRDDGYWGDVYL